MAAHVPHDTINRLTLRSHAKVRRFKRNEGRGLLRCYLSPYW